MAAGSKTPGTESGKPGLPRTIFLRWPRDHLPRRGVEKARQRLAGALRQRVPDRHVDHRDRIELIAALMTLIFVFITKQLLFKGMPRPTKYFENEEVLHLVEGVKMHEWNSFPSGHTITAFAIFMILVLVVKNNYLKFLFVMIAILAGYSRVYLSQHFLGDIFTGAIIGSLIAVCSCSFVDYIGIFKKATWIDKNLSQLFGEKHEQ